MKPLKYIVLFYLALQMVGVAHEQNRFRLYDNTDSLFFAFARGEYVPVLKEKSKLKTRLENWSNQTLDSIYRAGSQNNAEPDSIIYKIRDKAIFDFDSAENIFSITMFNYDSNSKTWNELSMQKEFYNTNNELFKIENYVHDTVLSIWIPNSITEKETKGQKVSSTMKKYDSEYNKWVNTSMYTITYDEFEQEIKYEYLLWSMDSLYWILNSTTINEYNAQGELIDQIIIDKNSETQQIDTSHNKHNDILYDENGNCVFKKEYLNAGNGLGLFKTTHYYDYNEHGLPKMIIDSIWNSSLKKLITKYKQIYSYTSFGMEDTILTYRWIPEQDIYYYYGIIVYTYTEEKKLQSEESWYFNEQGDTMHIDRYLLFYNKRSDVMREKYTYWDSSNDAYVTPYDNFYYFPIHYESVEISGDEITIIFDDYLQAGDVSDAIQIVGNTTVTLTDAYVDENSPDKLTLMLNKLPDDGEYITISETNNLITTDNRLVTFSIALGNNPDVEINIPSSLNQINVYPTECKNTLWVSSDDIINTWEIINTSGVVVLKASPFADTILSISTKQLYSGTYFLRLMMTHGETTLVKFIKK